MQLLRWTGGYPLDFSTSQVLGFLPPPKKISQHVYPWGQHQRRQQREFPRDFRGCFQAQWKLESPSGSHGRKPCMGSGGWGNFCFGSLLRCSFCGGNRIVGILGLIEVWFHRLVVVFACGVTDTSQNQISGSCRKTAPAIILWLSKKGANFWSNFNSSRFSVCLSGPLSFCANRFFSNKIFLSHSFAGFFFPVAKEKAIPSVAYRDLWIMWGSSRSISF